MISPVPKHVKLWGRGQMTIPKEFREALKLDDETQLNIFVVGQSLVLTPKKLMRNGLSKNMEKSMKQQQLSLEDLLRDLKNERQRFVKEKYGQ